MPLLTIGLLSWFKSCFVISWGMLSHDVMAAGDASLCRNAQRRICSDTDLYPQQLSCMSLKVGTETS